MVASLLQELVERDGLRIALSGRDDASLQSILRFCVRNITLPRYTRLLVVVSEVLLDIYGQACGLSSQVDSMFAKLADKLRDELSLHQSLMQLLGSMDIMLASTRS